jgi:hypothetical protein
MMYVHGIQTFTIEGWSLVESDTVSSVWSLSLSFKGIGCHGPKDHRNEFPCQPGNHLGISACIGLPEGSQSDLVTLTT